MNDIETANKFLVSARGNQILVLNHLALLAPLSADDALLLAANLVAIAEPGAAHSFQEVLTAVLDA